MKIPNDYMEKSYRMEITEDKNEGGAVANALDAKKAWFEAYFQNNDCETFMLRL